MTSAEVLPLRTERVLVRGLMPDDVATFTAYRNDPDVARYQQWPLPYTTGMALQLAHDPAVTSLVPGEWVQLAIDDGTGTLLGDLGVHLDEGGKVATIGYTLAPEHQGRGLASEAVGAVVDRLFEHGIHRVAATLDPDNVASARLVERLGFRYEGRLREASYARGGWTDDECYAVLPTDRRDWLSRSTDPPGEVRLVEITDDNADAAIQVKVHHSQRRFVASVLESLADALLPGDHEGEPARPWFRLAEADGVPAGFVMVALPSASTTDAYLWRFLVDARHQGRGVGRRMIGLVAREMAAAGATTMTTSWVEARGGPEPFYRRLGFDPTGEIDEGEVVARVPIDTLIDGTA